MSKIKKIISNMINKYSNKGKINKQDLENIGNEFSNAYIDSFEEQIKKMDDDYHNPNNYPLYQREYYELSKISPKNEQEWDNFYNIVNDKFIKIFLEYKNINLNEKELNLKYYKENSDFYFLDNNNKLLRKIGNYYKKEKLYEKSISAFSRIISLVLDNLDKNDSTINFIETIRQNDLKSFLFLAKKLNYTEYNNLNVNDIEKHLIKLQEYDLVKRDLLAKGNIKWLLERGEYEFKKHTKTCAELGVIGYKKIDTQDDSCVCNICEINKNVGWIESNKIFPSGHIYPPFHIDGEKYINTCRCNILYSITDKNGSLDFKK